MFFLALTIHLEDDDIFYFSQRLRFMTAVVDVSIDNGIINYHFLKPIRKQVLQMSAIRHILLIKYR